MIEPGFALERISDGAEIQWWSYLPGKFEVEEDLLMVMGAPVGWENGKYRLVAKDRVSPDPEPSRRMIDKAVIVERLTDAQLEKALSLMSTRQKERWRMPGYPAVYADDPEVVGLVKAIGSDPAVVLA